LKPIFISLQCSDVFSCINCISSHWVLLFLLSSRHPLDSKPRALETHLHFSPMLRCFQFIESADVPKKCKSLGRSLIFFLPVLNADEDVDECGHEQNLPCFFCVIYLQPYWPYLPLSFFWATNKHKATLLMTMKWWKKRVDFLEIKFHFSKILNDMACNLNWIQLNEFN